MQKPGLKYEHIHDFCINAIQATADMHDWSLAYGKLKPEDISLLKSGAFGDLPWPWAFEQYGDQVSGETLDLSMRIKGIEDEFLGGAALCRIDHRRQRLEICMVENFLKNKTTPLTKRVWLSTLFFAFTLAKATKHDEIFIMNPKLKYIPLYRSFGFYEDATCPPNLSATLEGIEEALIAGMNG